MKLVSLTLREEHRVCLLRTGSRGEYLDLREKWQEAGEDGIMKSFIVCTLHQILKAEQIKDNQIGGTCSMHGGDEKYHFVRKTR
jgi:hypothetical protein